MELPIKIEGILFSREKGEYKFLILKRSKKEGEYWQPLTGTVNDDESLKDCLKRELKEEVSIDKIISIIDDVYHFNWEWDGEVYLEFVYAIELEPGQQVKLSEEHDDYAWVTFDEAINKLAKDNNKKAFQEFKKKVMVAS